jgi:hypothetical protein
VTTPVLLLHIFPTNKPVPHSSFEVFNEFPQAALLWLRFIRDFHLHPGHRLWLGQFWFESYSDADSGNYTVTYASSNSQSIANAYAHARTIECGDHGPGG